jgi:teichuronic acid biosynthesis glycosyltransferase TuaG
MGSIEESWFFKAFIFQMIALLIGFLRKCLERFLQVMLWVPNMIPIGLPARPGIFPWALLANFWFGVRPNIGLKLFGGFLVLYFLGYSYWNYPLVDGIRSLAAIGNAFGIYWVVLSLAVGARRHLDKVFVGVFGAFLVLTAVQWMHLMPAWMGRYIEQWIPHFKPYGWGGDRGVAGWFSEPALAASAFQFMAAYGWYSYQGQWKKKSFALAVVLAGMLFWQVWVIKSFVGVLFWFMFVFGIMTVGQRLGALMVLVLVLSVVKAFDTGNMIPVTELPRSLIVLHKILFLQNPDDWLAIVNEKSGFRMMGWMASMNYGLQHPMGCGLGGWRDASLEAMTIIGIPVWPLHLVYQYLGGDHLGFRPTSLLSGLMLETGWIGTVLAGSSLLPALHTLWKSSDRAAGGILFLWMGVVAGVGHLGDPIPMLVLGLVVHRHWLNERKSFSLPALADDSKHIDRRPMPLVSIVMPCYRADDTIGEAIEGVLGQTYTHWELLVIVDGATTPPETWKHGPTSYQDPRIRWIPSRIHRGVSRARNLGIRCARGTWIAFCDADDRWQPSKLSRQWSLAVQSSANVLCSRYTFWARNHDRTEWYKKAYFPAQPDPSMLKLTNFIGLSTAMVRRDFITNTYFETRPNSWIHEDYAYWIKLFERPSLVLAFDHASLVDIRVQPASRSSNKALAARSHYEILKEFYRDHPHRFSMILWSMGHYFAWALIKSGGDWFRHYPKN